MSKKTLKYYEEENRRYGQMGAVTEEEALKALQVAHEHFKAPRVVLEVSKRRRTKSCYKVGLGMNGWGPRKAKPLALPKIVMAHTMMDWITLCHEYAHHLHCVRLNAGPNPAVREHAHGKGHAAIMQEVVNFFVANGMIKTPPLYMESLKLVTPESWVLDYSPQPIMGTV